MKKYLIFTGLVFGSLVSAQVVIKTNVQQAISSPSVSLEFGSSVPGGIVLPYVTQATAEVEGAEEGTFIFDPNDRKVKMKNTSGGWLDLTGGALTTNTITLPSSTALTNDINAKVVIGTNPSQVATKGIFILSDDNKAMVLPKMESPHLNIINPAPGMMVYDTHDKQVAVYNGTQWSFWK